jgi:xanthine dehydrogenase YagS FAD-binding subunit
MTMAAIRDIISAFELFQPLTVDDALRLVDKYRDDYWVLAGGLDSMDWLKDRLRKPRYVIDLTRIPELVGIRDANGGVEIGAMTPLVDVVRHPLVRERFGLLAEAAELVASPQIRNQGTIGGNVSQDTRCWYYRGGWNCYRAGGNVCYADTPTAVNREHAILDADRCVAVSPSDTAPAFVALDAQMVVRSARGERVVSAEDYFVGPGIDITRMTVLYPGDVGGRAVLLREGPRPSGLGLSARQCRVGHQVLERQDRWRAPRGRRRRGEAEAARPRRSGDYREAAR